MIFKLLAAKASGVSAQEIIVSGSSWQLTYFLLWPQTYWLLLWSWRTEVDLFLNIKKWLKNINVKELIWCDPSQLSWKDNIQLRTTRYSHVVHPLQMCVANIFSLAATIDDLSFKKGVNNKSNQFRISWFLAT